MSSYLKVDHIEGRNTDCPGCAWARFRSAITSAWNAETSINPDWSVNNRALGQCAVTALIVQDAYGGDLVRTEVDGVSHYFNRLPGGAEIDLTRDQFTEWEPAGFETRERSYVLSFKPTAERYELLLRRVLLSLALVGAKPRERHDYLKLAAPHNWQEVYG